MACIVLSTVSARPAVLRVGVALRDLVAEDESLKVAAIIERHRP